MRSCHISSRKTELYQSFTLKSILESVQITTVLTISGLSTSVSSHALGESSPPLSPITMSHTTPSMYPTSNLSHNATYQTTQSHSIGYLPTSNPYNSQMSHQYNSLGHSYTNKSILGNLNSLGPQQLGTSTIGSSLGQTGMVQSALGPSTLGQNAISQGILGHSSMGQSSLPNSLGTTVLGGSLAQHQMGNTSMLGQASLGSSGLGTNLVPSSYATCSIANTFSNQLVTNNPAALSQSAYSNPVFSNPVTSALNQYSLPYNPVTSTNFGANVTFSNPLTSQFNNLPISAPASLGMTMKLTPLEEVELGKDISST